MKATTWLMVPAVALTLASSASAATIYTLTGGHFSASTAIHNGQAVDLGPWEISEGPYDYAPDRYARNKGASVAADFAVMEEAPGVERVLFLHPQD